MLELLEGLKWDKLKYLVALWLIFVMFLILHKNDNNNFLSDLNSDKFRKTSDTSYFSSGANECHGENMVYNVTLSDARTMYGQKFNCSMLWLLERFKLADKYAITEEIKVKFPGDSKFVFVAAANDAFFPSLKAMLAHTKAKFGCKQHIIAYDLGGITKNKEMMNELLSVCNLEWRTFDFTQMPENVRHLKSFAWKIFIISQMLMEYDTVVWLDTSILFYSNDLSKFLEPMQNDKIGHIQMLSFTSHGINFATHPKTFAFLPLRTNFEPPITYEPTGTDPPMFEANFIIVHKSEQSRQMMKWALLCAAEAECIVPTGSTIDCHNKDRHKAGECHRQDQSVISAVTINMEQQLKDNDPFFMTHFDPNHPRNKNNPKRYATTEAEAGMTGLFHIARLQNFHGTKSEFLNQVQCC